MEATIRKIGDYLDKADAASWWKSLFEDAQKYMQPSEPHAREGMDWMSHLILCLINWIAFNTGSWIRRNLTPSPVSKPHHMQILSKVDMSGVEVVSPHKLIAMANE